MLAVFDGSDRYVKKAGGSRIFLKETTHAVHRAAVAQGALRGIDLCLEFVQCLIKTCTLFLTNSAFLFYPPLGTT